jgi:hypothetical protein
MKFFIKNIIIAFLLVCLISCDSVFQQRISRFKEEKICGKVSKKYIDELNHYHKSLILNNSYDLGIEIWDNDSIDLWNFISIGDSVNKPKGSYDLTVIKQNGLSVKFKYNK